MRSLSALLATSVIVLTACGSDGGGPAPTPAARPSSTGRLEVTAPQPGEVIQDDGVTVRLRLEGASVIRETSTRLAPDEGHIHLSLDGRLVTLLGGLEERLTGLTPGQHVIQAEFVASDHGPFSPRVIQVVTFSVA
jgi:hypothetical protein